MVARDTAKLLVNERNQALKRLLVAIPPAH
jgi:hypothetical protein